MTDMAAALADTSALKPFEGEKVLAAGIEIPGAAGGLREAMKIDPQEFHGGERLYVVLECVVGKVRFDPIRHDDERLGWRRVHVLEAEHATFVDGDLVSEQLAAQRRRIELAKEAANGVGRIPYDDELVKAHADGLHASGLIPGCAECDTEADLAQSEAQADADAAEAASAPTPIAGRRSRKDKPADG